MRPQSLLYAATRYQTLKPIDDNILRLRTISQFNYMELSSFAESYNMEFYAVSSLTGEGIDKLLTRIVELHIENLVMNDM